jgi:ABC transporter substrate binding protein
MPVIGFLGATSPGPFAAFVAAFHQGLNETGFVEGQNLAIEYRWTEGDYNQLPALAADLVGRKVDLIVAAGGFAAALAAKSATSTTPIVFTGVSDPVAVGLVASLARPGGNITGFSGMTATRPPSPPSSNCMPAGSSSAPTRSFSAGASNSWRWHHARPFQRSIRGGSLSWPGA